MKLKVLLNKYLYNEMLEINYYHSGKIETEIPENIVEFIGKINDDEWIDPAEFAAFSKQFLTLDPEARKCINYLLYDLSFSKYLKFKQEIEHVVKTIEQSVKQGVKIPQSLGDNANKYIGLLNCHQLLAHYVPRNERGHHGFIFPLISPIRIQNVEVELPLAINALRLVGELPRTANFHGHNLSKPFYPLNLRIVASKKVPLKRGIKDSEEYFPYKMIRKLNKGDTGDNTFVATNGKKILFVRGVEYYSPNAVFASKIATLVSPNHFSSERLLDNHLVAAREIRGYVVSTADPSTRLERKTYIEEDKKIFPGSGIIDEVTNFVGETDYNIENFGFSSRKISQSHLTKIDFDRCNVMSEISKDNYDRNILTQFRGGIYHGAPHIQTDPNYLREKLFARLKLSMLTRELLCSLAEKSFAPEDADSVEGVVDECTNRSNFALELLLEHPNIKVFLKENPSIFDQCYHQIQEYIDSHFADEDLKLENSVKKRVETIRSEVQRKLGITLMLGEERSEIISKSPQLKAHPAVDSVVESHPRINTAHKFEPKSITSETTFLSRNWLKLLGLASLTLIGIGVGLALTATGVFAPLGAGVLGLTLGAALGFAGGLAIGGTSFGAKIIYDEYQERSMSSENRAKEAILKPSLEVQQSIHESEIAGQQMKRRIAEADIELERYLVAETEEQVNGPPISISRPN